MNTKGRPTVLDDDDILVVTGHTAATMLQEGSERRAIVNRLIELGGRATVKELCSAFGYELRPKIRALIGAGWLDHTPGDGRTTRLPRRSQRAGR